jgi:hypothetical protein
MRLFFQRKRAKIEEKNQVNLNLTLKEITLNLDEIQSLAKGFIPRDIEWKGMNNAQLSDFNVEEAKLTGTLPDGTAHLAIQNMALNLSKLDLALSKERLSVELLNLLIPHTAVDLENRFPKNLRLNMSLGAKTFASRENNPLS